ncbi:putative baseplate assembly protein [Streptomyces afghaniensis]|uniref:putative baseplate assembly protein n=1 Tax=Streptomyces TaxID=1883 RepID=UPI001FAF8ED2|nr:putative baseplate assembly protein [Streptomyces sp. HP-A2021]UOB15373.1 putative baseplate assembly protein [Streptomyces sp. HP-A2021]
MTPESNRGRILPPDLDDRTWADLAAEMRALRTTYAPQWTDDSPSDIGITLIELFAWLGEGVIYRLNQVPEKNYLAFLDLMGITRDPAAPAATHLTFGTKGPPLALPTGSQAHTLPEEGQAPVVFETDEAVTVLPVNLTTAVLLTPDPDDSSFLVHQDVTARLTGAATTHRPLPVRAGTTTHVCLGFDEATTEDIELRPRLFRPAPQTSPQTPPQPPSVTVTWAASAPDAQPPDWPATGPTGTGKDLHDTRVRLPTPQDWAAQNPRQDWENLVSPEGSAVFGEPRFWIGLRLTNETDTDLEIGLDRVLFNAAPAHTALTVRAGETLGESDGTPFQVFRLRHSPLYRRPDPEAPYADLEVQVGQGTPPVWETWQLVPELLPGPHRSYRLNPVTGEIGFGSHDDRNNEGHGSIPPPGSLIRARIYRHVVSGTAGNVSAGRIVVTSTRPDGTVPTGLTVTNARAAVGGRDEEPVEETLRRAPEALKIQDRALTADDYAHLARQASSDVRISKCLPPHPPHGDPWTFGGIDRAPGNVTVIVVPDQGPDVPRPEPPPELLHTVREYLDPRRDLTVRLFVHGPRYLPIKTDLSVVVWNDAVNAGVDLEQVKTEVENRIADFFHPTRGGPTGRGWEVGQQVFSSDLFRAVMPTEDVGYIETISIEPAMAEPEDRPPLGTDPGASVQVADFELVCAGPAEVDVRRSA